MSNSIPTASSNPVLDELRALAPTLSIGVLTANLLELGAEMARIREAGARVAHVDVMDGRFCPALTVGPPLVKAMRREPMILDVHLMIEEPLAQAEAFFQAGADVIVFQGEATRHPHRVLQRLGQMATEASRGLVRGVGLNPGTPVEMVEPLLDDLELVLLLAVNPGWGGQSFIPSTVRRLEKLKNLIAQSGRPILTMIDGGITKSNIGEVAQMGADLIVTGSAVFDGKDAAENAREMLEIVINAKR